jgi:hypothetical protein
MGQRRRERQVVLINLDSEVDRGDAHAFHRRHRSEHRALLLSKPTTGRKESRGRYG